MAAEDQAHLRSEHAFLDRQVRKYERKAGPAKDGDITAASERLTAATDVFANEDWSNLTVKEVAAAGRRIALRADQYLAAQALPALKRARDLKALKLQGRA